MQKIPTLFVRDYEKIITGFEPISTSTNSDGSITMASKVTESKKGRFLATDQVTPGCEWVINGKGIATRKWDGMCCKIENGILYKRYDAKHGKTPPEGFIPTQDPDPITGHWPGWLQVDRAPENRWINEAYENMLMLKQVEVLEDGTYEAVGPKINGFKDHASFSAYGWGGHVLIKHGTHIFMTEPRDFEGLKKWFAESDDLMEGIVWHHPDGRMCKIKRSDFGLKW